MDYPAVLHQSACRLARACVYEAGCVSSLLQVHSKVDEVHDDLCVCLRLGRAAHDAEGDPRCSVLRDEGWDDRVEGALARGIAIWLSGFEVKELAAVLQDESQVGWRHSGAHAAVVALDERDHVAFGIRCAEVDGVSFFSDGCTWGLSQCSVLGVNQRAAFVCVFFRDQALNRSRREVGVRIEPSAVLKGELLGFDEVVEVIDASVAPLADRVWLEQIEDLKRSDALSIGGQLPEINSSVVRGDGVDPV